MRCTCTGPVLRSPDKPEIINSYLLQRKAIGHSNLRRRLHSGVSLWNLTLESCLHCEYAQRRIKEQSVCRLNEYSMFHIWTPPPSFQNSRSNTAICLHDGVASNVIEAHCRHGSKFWISSVFSVTCRKRNVFSSLHIACMVFKEVNETGQQVHLREIVQCVQDVDSVVCGLWRAWQNTYYKSAIPVLCLLISIIGQLLPT